MVDAATATSPALEAYICQAKGRILWGITGQAMLQSSNGRGSRGHVLVGRSRAQHAPLLWQLLYSSRACLTWRTKADVSLVQNDAQRELDCSRGRAVTRGGSEQHGPYYKGPPGANTALEGDINFLKIDGW